VHLQDLLSFRRVLPQGTAAFESRGSPCYGLLPPLSQLTVAGSTRKKDEGGGGLVIMIAMMYQLSCFTGFSLNTREV
jgi:hypothetical protein